MSVSINFHMETQEDATNALNALSVFAKGFLNEFPDPVIKGIQSTDTVKHESPLSGKDLSGTSESNKSEIKTEQQETESTKGEQVGKTDNWSELESLYPAIDYNKQRYTPDERTYIVKVCEICGITAGKTSTVNLVKQLKKHLTDLGYNVDSESNSNSGTDKTGSDSQSVQGTGGDSDNSSDLDMGAGADGDIMKDLESGDSDPVQTSSSGKVDMAELRQIVGICATTLGKEKVFALMDSRCGARGITNIDESKYPLLMSACKASLAFKKFVDAKGEPEAIKMLALIGGPNCKKFSDLSDDKLDALTKSCEEVLSCG